MSDRGEPVTGSVLARVAQAHNLSKAESAIARWLEAELMNRPFDTAGELAGYAGVSEMTVTRFVRRLGYANFKAFKSAVNADLRGDSGFSRTILADRVAIPGTGQDELAQQLQMELDAIVDVYRLATTDQWASAIDVIQAARHVNVAGFQGSAGLAMDFATRLKYARSGVRYASGLSGNWSELFAEAPGESCVIMVDTVPYAQVSLKIADLCLHRGIPLVTVTDRYHPWPRQYTPHALSVSTETRTFLDSTAGLSALLGLMLNAITARLGPAAQERLREMSALGQHFQAYTFDPGTQARPMAPARQKGTP